MKDMLRPKTLVFKGFLRVTDAALTKNTSIIHHLFIKINSRINVGRRVLV